MKIYLDSDKVLHIDDKVFKQEIPLIFVFKEGKKFDIQIAGSNNTILGRIFDLENEVVTNFAGVAYTTVQEIYDALNLAWLKNEGIAYGSYLCTPSNTVDLPIPGWFEPRLAGGTIKFTPVKGADRTLTFDIKELSKVQAKRIWATGTTATEIEIYTT
jgi:hypothetical protein